MEHSYLYKIFIFLLITVNASTSHLFSSGECSDARVMSILLSADSTSINVPDNQGMTPLYKAVSNNKDSCVAILLEFGANPNSRTIKDQTPLMKACHEGYSEIVQMLLQAKALSHLKSQTGKTALHYAVLKGHQDCIELLLKKNTIDVNALDNQGSTPLLLATDFKIIKTLLEAGADPSLKNKNGKNAWHIFKNNRLIISLLNKNKKKHAHRPHPKPIPSTKTSIANTISTITDNKKNPSKKTKRKKRRKNKKKSNTNLKQTISSIAKVTKTVILPKQNGVSHFAQDYLNSNPWIPVTKNQRIKERSAETIITLNSCTFNGHFYTITLYNFFNTNNETASQFKNQYGVSQSSLYNNTLKQRNVVIDKILKNGDEQLLLVDKTQKQPAYKVQPNPTLFDSDYPELCNAKIKKKLDLFHLFSPMVDNYLLEIGLCVKQNHDKKPATINIYIPGEISLYRDGERHTFVGRFEYFFPDTSSKTIKKCHHRFFRPLLQIDSNGFNQTFKEMLLPFLKEQKQHTDNSLCNNNN